MEINITIIKADVIAEVNKTSAYIGAKTITQDGGNLYYNISTIKEDAEMLERYWREASGDVAAVAKPFVKSVRYTTFDWNLRLEMPSTYNEALTEVAEQRIFSYIVRYILLNWLKLCSFDPNVIQAYGTECQGLLTGVDDILHARLSARAADGPQAEDNEYGGDEAPDLSGEDEELCRSGQYGGDLRQNLGEEKAVIIRYRRR